MYTRSRRRMRFSLFALFCAITSMALMVGIVAMQRDAVAARRATANTLAAEGVVFGDASPGHGEWPPYLVRVLCGDTGLVCSASASATKLKNGDRIAAQLGTLAGLKILDIEQCGLTDAGAESLTGLHSMRYLWMYRNPISDRGVSLLARNMPMLEVLDAAGPGASITDACMADVARLARLRALGMWDTGIGDAGLALLGGSGSKLERLEIDGTRVTDNGLAVLDTLPCLERLAVSRTAISDAGVPHIAQCSKLTWLDLSETKVTDAGVALLSKLSRLKHLSLRGTTVSDTGMKSLAQTKTLEELDIRGTKTTGGGILSLCALKSLKRLDTDVDVNDEAMQALYRALPSAQVYAPNRTGVYHSF